MDVTNKTQPDHRETARPSVVQSDQQTSKKKMTFQFFEQQVMLLVLYRYREAISVLSIQIFLRIPFLPAKPQAIFTPKKYRSRIF
jgi:hypothetical protein